MPAPTPERNTGSTLHSVGRSISSLGAAITWIVVGVVLLFILGLLFL